MREFFVPGKPRQRGSKTAIPVRLKNGQFKTVPTKNGKKRLVMRYVDAAKGSTDWKDVVSAVASSVAPAEPWDCPVTVVLTFVYQRPATHWSKRTGELLPSAPLHKATMPDVDKLTRSVFDAMNRLIYYDDGRVVSLSVLKCWSKNHEGVLVRVWSDAPVRNVDDEIDSVLAQQEAAKPF